MAEPSKYRLAPAHGLVAVGVGVVSLAVATILWFLLREIEGFVGVVVTIVLVMAIVFVIAVILLAVFRPVVAVLDDEAFHAKIRTGAMSAGRPVHTRIVWTDVVDVETMGGILNIRGAADDGVDFPLALVAPRERLAMLREVHERLNEANGYRRL